jgi:6,7-dimethyl-8-ribityllumazine synthase
MTGSIASIQYDARRRRVVLIAARFNVALVDQLIAGARQAWLEHGGDDARLLVERVPGAFELPLAAKMYAASGGVDAVVAQGCVIRGDTPHFDYVAGECARGIQEVAVSEGLPVIFGVLTTNTQQQALDRIGGAHGHAGERAAEAAVEMIALALRVAKA